MWTIVNKNHFPKSASVHKGWLRKSDNHLMHIISIKFFVATCWGDYLREIIYGYRDYLWTKSPESRGHNQNWPRKFWQDFNNSLALLKVMNSFYLFIKRVDFNFTDKELLCLYSCYVACNLNILFYLQRQLFLCVYRMKILENSRENKCGEVLICLRLLNNLFIWSSRFSDFNIQSVNGSEAYSKPCQRSKMEHLRK